MTENIYQRSGVPKPMGLDEFMGHSSSGGGRASYLRGWKKNRPPEVDVWLHTRAGFFALWQHNLPMVRTWDDKKTNLQRSTVWSQGWNCWCDEDTLKSQYFVDNAGRRQKPPHTCPACLLREHVRQLVASGQLTIVDQVFYFDAGESQDPNDERYKVITAGGILNSFSKMDKLSEEEKQLVAQAGIKVGGDDGAWRENMAAKCNYVFAVVDDANPGAGVQIAIEGTALGNAVKRAIAHEIKRSGKEAGNPFTNPYAMKWTYDSKQAFEKQYDAMALNLQITDEIQRLIYDEDPPDLTRVCRPGDVRTLRQQWEQFAVIELPFDELFGEAERMQASDPDADDSFNYGANEQGEAQGAASAGAAAPQPGPQAPQPAPQARQAAVSPPAQRAPARAAAPAQRQPAPPPARQAPPAASPGARQAAPPPRGAPQAPPRQPVRPGGAQAPATRGQAQPPPARQAAPPARAAAPARPAPPPPRAPAQRQPAPPPRQPAPLPPQAEAQAESEPCGKCGAPMGPDDLKCGACGMEYQWQESPPAAPAPAQAEAETVPGPDAPSADEWSPEDGNQTGGPGDEFSPGW